MKEIFLSGLEVQVGNFSYPGGQSRRISFSKLKGW